MKRACSPAVSLCVTGSVVGALSGPVIALSLLLPFLACDGASPDASTPPSDAGSNADASGKNGAAALNPSEGGTTEGIGEGGTGGDGGANGAGLVRISGSDADILSIGVSPLALVPSFSPSIHNYVVRCAAGDNPVTVTVTDRTGAHSTALDLVEDQAIIVQDIYWIRCLPHDFPTITVTSHPDVGVPTPGYYLVNSGNYGVALDPNGTPVWYAREVNLSNVDAPAVDTISFNLNGTAPYGWSMGEKFALRALDSATTKTLGAVGSPTDGHELRLLADGEYLVFTYPIESHVDLTGLGPFGADQNMADCEIQQVDAQGNLVWSWRMSDHIDPVKESLEPMVNTINGQSVVDVFHCNAIDVEPSGDLLVSVRHANAIYSIERATGTIEWKLGGTAYSKDGASLVQVTGDPEGTFSMQHDARLLPNGDISMFDDHGGSPGMARGVEYALDLSEGTATVVWQFLGIGQSQYEGSFRRYADGESVIGWGYVPNDPRVVTEVDSNRNDVLDVAFTGGPSYRAIKVPLAQLDIDVLRTMTAK